MKIQGLTVNVPTFKGFVEFAKNNKHLVDIKDSIVEFIVLLSERAILSGDDHVYYDPYLIVQLVSGVRGACFLHPGDISEKDFDVCVGKPVLDIVENIPLPIGIALLDAYYSLLNQKLNVKSQADYTFNGMGAEKSVMRAQKIVELAEIKQDSRVLLIGVISDIVREIQKISAQVRLSDFLLSGTQVNGIEVVHDCTPFLDWADTIIMTGNVLKTETLEYLLKRTNNRKKKVVVYALTGGNIAPYYLRHGANVVTVEKFPFYWYANLPSIMEVYLR